MSEPAIKKLGTFLADLTQDKPPDQIHQEILERLRDPDQDLDHRLAGIYLHVKDFVPIWTAIRNGVSLPASSWETVVLPAVVHFSGPQNVKPHLESATSLFLSARGGREIETDAVPPPVYDPEPLSLLDSVFGDPGDPGDEERARPVPVAAGGRIPTRTGRRWVPQAAAVTIVAVAAVVIWNGGGGDHPGGNSFSALPERPVVVVPTTEPSPSPSLEPSASASASPTPGPGPGRGPAPTTGGPGVPPPQPGQPPRIPGAPTGLMKTAVDRTSATLSWRAPADVANVAYYKIFQDGQPVVRTIATSDRVIQLQPATAYTFVVRAYNRADQDSQPSNSIIVITGNPIHTTFDVPKSVMYGSSFGIGGTGWPCSDVHVLIDGNAVQVGKVDQFGSFNTQVKVHDEAGEPGFVDIIGGERLHLKPGNWPMTATCLSGPPTLSDSVDVDDVPMSEPSTAPAG